MSDATKVRRGHRRNAPQHNLSAAELDIALQIRHNTGSPLTFGAPTRCPRCANYGLVDSVNEATGRQVNHCPVCFEHWTLVREAIEAANEAAAAPDPVPGGILIDAGPEPVVVTPLRRDRSAARGFVVAPAVLH